MILENSQEGLIATSADSTARWMQPQLGGRAGGRDLSDHTMPEKVCILQLGLLTPTPPFFFSLDTAISLGMRGKAQWNKVRSK